MYVYIYIYIYKLVQRVKLSCPLRNSPDILSQRILAGIALGVIRGDVYECSGEA